MSYQSSRRVSDFIVITSSLRLKLYKNRNVKITNILVSTVPRI